MQVFAIFGVNDPEHVVNSLREHYSADYYIADNNTFFVASVGETTRQLADRIGFDGSREDLRGIVIAVHSYWGAHSRDLWEWISVKESR